MTLSDEEKKERQREYRRTYRAKHGNYATNRQYILAYQKKRNAEYLQMKKEIEELRTQLISQV